MCLCTLNPTEVNAIAKREREKKMRQRYLHITQNRHDKKSHRQTAHKEKWEKKKYQPITQYPSALLLEYMLCWKYFYEKQGKRQNRQIHKNMQSRLAAHTVNVNSRERERKNRSQCEQLCWRNNKWKKNGSKSYVIIFFSSTNM